MMNLMMMEESSHSSGGFSELKGYCLKLLNLIQNPNLYNNNNQNHIFNNLVSFFRQSSPHHLQPFFDYTMFPLVLLLEAAVECRSPSVAEGAPPKISDAVAEGTLRCLEQLLIKCHVPSLDKMVVLLKKLTNAALLSPSQASEEFRQGVITCFKALLNALCFCSNPSCQCKQLKSLPRLIDNNRYSESSFPINEIDIDECLLAFIRSQSAAVTVGHWLSLL